MSAPAERRMIVLIVEDNPGDVALFREACEANRTRADFHVVTDGEEALTFLRRASPFDRAPRPDVVVLDLNLPLKNGREVIVEMASDAAMNSIPVAVLTTSTSETQVCEIYPKGRCLYFSKTDDFAELKDIARRIAAHAEQARSA